MAATTDLWTYRGLIGNLAQRELKARYKRSVLGWAWSLINPATTLLTYAIVFGTLLKVEPPVAGNGEPQNFALYLFCGLVVWNYFAGVVNGAMGALVGAGPLLRKVFFPPECPVIANSLVALTQTAIEVGVLLAIMIVRRQRLVDVHLRAAALSRCSCSSRSASGSSSVCSMSTFAMFSISSRSDSTCCST